MKYTVHQFTETDTLQIEGRAQPMAGRTERFVTLRQSAASLHFQFDMTPEQARHMASMLLLAVQDAEGSK